MPYVLLVVQYRHLNLRQRYTFNNILGIGVTTQKGLLHGIELVPFFGNSQSPLQYSVVGDTPQTSHKSQHSENVAYLCPNIKLIGQLTH